MVIRRLDPFNELRRMQANMDQMWRGFARPIHVNGGPVHANGEMGGWAIPLDVVQEGENMVVHASIPGVDPSDINVSIENDVLTIRGESGGMGEAEGGKYLVRERHAGAFRRSLHLPDTLDLDNAVTHYDRGVLRIVFPMLAAKQTRQLPITVAGAEPAIEAAAS